MTTAELDDRIRLEVKRLLPKLEFFEIRDHNNLTEERAKDFHVRVINLGVFRTHLSFRKDQEITDEQLAAETRWVMTQLVRVIYDVFEPLIGGKHEPT